MDSEGLQVKFDEACPAGHPYLTDDGVVVAHDRVDLLQNMSKVNLLLEQRRIQHGQD